MVQNRLNEDLTLVSITILNWHVSYDFGLDIFHVKFNLDCRRSLRVAVRIILVVV